MHRKCLDHWRSVKVSNLILFLHIYTLIVVIQEFKCLFIYIIVLQEGFAFTHCTTCKAAFRLEVKEVKFDMVTRIKHKLFVVRDFFIHFVIAQAVSII